MLFMGKVESYDHITQGTTLSVEGGLLLRHCNLKDEGELERQQAGASDLNKDPRAGEGQYS